MLDKKMTPPENQGVSGANPSDPSMADPGSQPPQDDQSNAPVDTVGGSPSDQTVQPQDDVSTSEPSVPEEDKDEVSAYPPMPPQVSEPAVSSVDETNKGAVVDTQSVDEGSMPGDQDQVKQGDEATIASSDASQLPVGEPAPSADAPSIAGDDSTVDPAVKDMAKPVEPPALDTQPDTSVTEGGDSEQNQDTTGMNSSQLPQQPITETPSGEQTLPDVSPPQPQEEKPDLGTSQVQADGNFQIPPASQTVGPSDQGQSQPIPPSPGGDSIPTAPLPQAQDDAAQEQTLKKAHEPVIILPDDYHAAMTIPVHIRVSSVPHPMDEDHYIEWIELFANGTSVGKVELKPKENEMAEAEFQVNIQKGMVLRAVAHCNKHGDWATEKTA